MRCGMLEVRLGCPDLQRGLVPIAVVATPLPVSQARRPHAERESFWSSWLDNTLESTINIKHDSARTRSQTDVCMACAAQLYPIRLTSALGDKCRPRSERLPLSACRTAHKLAKASAEKRTEQKDGKSFASQKQALHTALSCVGWSAGWGGFRRRVVSPAKEAASARSSMRASIRERARARLVPEAGAGAAEAAPAVEASPPEARPRTLRARRSSRRGASSRPRSKRAGS